MQGDLGCLAEGVGLPVLRKLLREPVDYLLRENLTNLCLPDDGCEEFTGLHLVDVFCLGVDVSDRFLVEILAQTFLVVGPVLCAPVGFADERYLVGEPWVVLARSLYGFKHLSFEFGHVPDVEQ